jgi:hypothetical protein
MFYFKVLFIYSCEKSENNYPTSQKGSKLLNFKVAFSNLLSQGSSVSTACGYGLDDRATGLIPSRGERIFSVACVSRPALRPSLVYNGYRVSFPQG